MIDTMLSLSRGYGDDAPIVGAEQAATSDPNEVDTDARRYPRVVNRRNAGSSRLAPVAHFTRTHSSAAGATRRSPKQQR
jgi:hypothetical protein